MDQRACSGPFHYAFYIVLFNTDLLDMVLLDMVLPDNQDNRLLQVLSSLHKMEPAAAADNNKVLDS